MNRKTHKAISNLNIFSPSKGGIGIKLKVDIYAFTQPISLRKAEYNGKPNDTIYKAIAITIFVIGPPATEYNKPFLDTGPRVHVLT